MTETIVGRRRFLSTLGALGIGPLAGCSGGGDTPTERATASATPTPTTPNEEAVEQYEAALEALVQNKGTLEDWAADAFEPSRVGTFQDRVSEAREALAVAEANADPSRDLMGQIEQARYVADVQELSLAYYEGVDVLFRVISDAKAFGDSELHQRAADSFADAMGVTADLRAVIDDLGAVLEQVDTDALNEPALEYSGDPLDHLDLDDRQAIEGADSYLSGSENIHLAFVQLETGQEHYEKEAFTDTREAWEVGRSKAQASKSAFEAAIDNGYTPQDLRQESIQVLGPIETIIEAFDKFVEGAKEAEAGNGEKANTLILEGFDILGQL